MTLSNIHSTFAVSVLTLCFISSTNLHAKELLVGRYSLLAATPTQAQIDLLATTITVQFPERLQNVGDAVHFLLLRSGYRLAKADASSAEMLALFELPLPAVHRTLGPISLREALETLAGSAFILVQDPVHRLISFEQCITMPVEGKSTRGSVSKEHHHED